MANIDSLCENDSHCNHINRGTNNEGFCRQEDRTCQTPRSILTPEQIMEENLVLIRQYLSQSINIMATKHNFIRDKSGRFRCIGLVDSYNNVTSQERQPYLTALNNKKTYFENLLDRFSSIDNIRLDSQSCHHEIRRFNNDVPNYSKPDDEYCEDTFWFYMRNLNDYITATPGDYNYAEALRTRCNAMFLPN